MGSGEEQEAAGSSVPWVRIRSRGDGLCFFWRGGR